MKSIYQLGNYTLSWLTSSEAPEPSEDFHIVRLPCPISPDTGTAWAETLSLPDGINLFRGVHELEPSPAGQLVRLMDVVSNTDEPIFGAQTWLSGLCCHREFWNGQAHPARDIVASPGRDTFRCHRTWRAEILGEGGITSEMRSVVVPVPTLAALLGAEITEDLLARLGLGGGVPTVVRVIPKALNAPLLQAMSREFVGMTQRLSAQARVLDYFAGLTRFVMGESFPEKESRHRKRILDLHDYLVHLEGRLPTLGDLSKEFGLSARRLNEEFIAEFGQSVFAFVKEHRLSQAHALLQTEVMPMKALSARLGYSHVNHFITAFKRKFGYSPGSLRRNKA